MPSTTMTSKGQMTVPKSVRDRLHLEAGTRMTVIVEDDGSFHCIPVHPKRIEEVAGCLRAYASERPVSTDAMDRAVGKAIRKRLKRSES